MALYRMCVTCRRPYPRGGRCPTCSAGAPRDANWKRIAQRVRARDRACMMVIDGIRCGRMVGLEVAHLDPRRAGGSDIDETRLVAVCHEHHLELERRQRAAAAG